MRSHHLKGNYLRSPVPDLESVLVYARVEEVNEEEGQVLLDCTFANSATLRQLIEESHRELKQRWRRSFRLIQDPAAPSMNLLSDVATAMVTVRPSNLDLWRGYFERADWLQVRLPPLALASAEPVTVGVTDSEVVPEREANKLSAILDMLYWPRVPAPELRSVLDAVPVVDGAVVHDVGQGSANALFDASGQAVVYFDVGRGGKMTSAPSNLELCSCLAPLVILSHWDRDHWAAAGDGTQGLLKSRWVVPSQKIAGTHATFAALILKRGGSILVVKRSSRPENVAPTGQRMYIKYVKGTDRNNTGLTMTLAAGFSTDRKVLYFPGDAKYGNCQGPPDQVDLLVASHHGADPKGTVNLPKPKKNAQSRLVYSFGPSNGYKHPFKAALAAHAAQGWDHAEWNHNGWEQSPTAGNVRATYTKSNHQRQSIVFPTSVLRQAGHFSSAHGETLSR